MKKCGDVRAALERAIREHKAKKRAKMDLSEDEASMIQWMRREVAG